VYQHECGGEIVSRKYAYGWSAKCKSCGVKGNTYWPEKGDAICEVIRMRVVVDKVASLVAALYAERQYRLREPQGPLVSRPPWGHDCQWCQDCVDRLNKMTTDALALAEKK
jgi:hypothetical protein